jgi:hypothetical protein
MIVQTASSSCSCPVLVSRTVKGALLLLGGEEYGGSHNSLLPAQM